LSTIKRKTAASKATLFSISVPVYDYVTVGEYADLKRLFFDQTEIQGLDRQFAAFAILARSRGNPDFDAESIPEDEPLPEDFDEVMERLLVPFARSWRKRARAEFKTQVELLGTPDLRTAIERAEETLATMRATLEERTGESSKPSSTPTTAAPE
jgi:hypothetical protein